jgi:hypothetical protein
MSVWEICLAIITSVGGVGVIVVAVFTFSGKILAKRLSSQFEMKLNKEMEEFKNSLEGKSYISKTMFDKEFAIYQDLTTLFIDAFSHLEVINGILNSGKQIISKDEVYLENPDLLKVADDVSSGKAIVETQIDYEYKQMAVKMMEFKKAIGCNSAFIPQDIRKLFTDVFNICHMYCNKKDDIEVEWIDVKALVDKMNTELRIYLNSLVVIE